jgi:hypothetical protein
MTKTMTGELKDTIGGITMIEMLATYRERGI